jgi:hypothetical protein
VQFFCEDSPLKLLPFVLLTTVGAPVMAQPMNMPGMSMPAPGKAAPAKPKKPAKKAARKATPATPPAKMAPAAPAKPTESVTTDHGQMAMPAEGADQSQANHSTMPGMQMGQPGHDHGAMKMSAALGPYPMQREASGTAWQPDNSEHEGLIRTSGDWTLMAHGVLNLVYGHQSGPRGDDKAFAAGMLMGMARRPLGNGTLQFKAMVSPDPIMGPSGYPLLLASGETANGVDRLTDRQHPHDFFMELSAAASQNIGRKSSVFVYAGLPGEPAFGPPAFQHREAIADSPEAPITHHWLDSTHISFGVVTGGIVLDRLKLEVSRFNGREPDQHRWDIETAPLDSTSLRLSWNPTASLALQGSWGHFVDPEHLEPGIDQKRLSASVLYAREIAPGWKFAGTLAWGRKTVEHHNDDAFAAEASIKHDNWTVFGRGEITDNRELTDDHVAYRVGKVSLGAVRDFRIAEHFSLGAGGLVAVNFVPDALRLPYGSSSPTGMMGFVRLKLY